MAGKLLVAPACFMGCSQCEQSCARARIHLNLWARRAAEYSDAPDPDNPKWRKAMAEIGERLPALLSAVKPGAHPVGQLMAGLHARTMKETGHGAH